MKKKVLSIILVGALVASLGAMAGCSNSAEKDEEKAEKEEEKADTEEEKADEAEEEGKEEKAEKDEEKADKDEAKAEEDEEKAESKEYDLSGLDDSETYTLLVTSHDPENSATGQFLTDWADSVMEASENHLDIQVYHGATLAGPTGTIDAITDGTADIGWGLQSFYADMFPVTEVFMLPLLDIDRATQGSEAIWEFYQTTDYMDEEYEDYHVLLLHTNCQSPISTVKTKIEELSDMEGMQIRGNSGPPTTFIQNLGANPVSVSINDLYSNLDKGTLDGCITDWHAISSFKLDETLAWYADENIGVSTYFLLMNKDKYEELPEVLQQILDDQSADAIQYTTAWDDVEDEMKATVEDEGKLYNFDDQTRSDLEDVAKETVDQWIEKTNGLGYDGQAIYDAAEECIANAKS